MPPLLPPAMQRSLPLVDSFRSNFLATNGRSSSTRKRTLLSPMPSYSKQRLRRPIVFFTVAGRSPGLTNTPIVTGISLVAISVSSSGFFPGVIAVGLDIDAGRFGAVVLRRDEDRRIPGRSRENDALGKRAALEHAMRNVLRFGRFCRGPARADAYQQESHHGGREGKVSHHSLPVVKGVAIRRGG